MQTQRQRRAAVALCLIAMAAAAGVARVAAAPATTVPLHNAAKPGVMMPIVGLGTGAYGTGPPKNLNGEHWNDTVGYAAVTNFLKAGGRRLDTSLKWYNDIDGVSAAIKDSPVPRSEVFVTGKVETPYGYNTTKQHIAELMAKDGLDGYVDLLLLHWPGPVFFLNHTTPNVPFCHQHGRECRQGSWQALIEAYNAGQARAIGVANYEQNHLQDILDMGSLVPAVNQIEYHPYWHEDALQAFCEGLNITVNGYAPLGAPDYMAFQSSRWPVLIPDQPAITAVAAATGYTPEQVILRWSLQRGVVINPRSENATHMAQNLDVINLTLTDAQMAAIAGVPKPTINKVCPDPHEIP